MSDNPFAGRTAVITGASRGIGAGLVRCFREAGVRVAGCSRTLPEGCDIAQEVDVVSESAVTGFCEEVTSAWGAIDLWINNAGILEPVSPLREVSPKDFMSHLEVNVLGVFNGTRAYIHHLRGREGGGVLMNISSGAAWQGYAGWSAYCAGKAAVDRLTESVQLEELTSGLRAYAIAPGVVDTHMQEVIRACSPEQFPMVDKFLEMKERDTFNSPEFVARHLLGYAFDPDTRTDDTLVSVPAERES